MKRYEKMSKEEVVEVLRKASGVCSGCTVPKKFCSRAIGALGCAGVVYKWLTEEVNQVPRVSTLKTAEDVKRARNEHTVLCDERYANKNGCDGCKYDIAKDEGFRTCYDYFLAEPVEVEE